VTGEAVLLPFPPPYRAALALSNDTDDLLEPGSWFSFLRFLNTRESTPWGEGLGLEVGDAFWFYSDHADEQPAAYFRGLGKEPSGFAPFIGTLGRSGHLDTLHSYGNFSRHGGFRREHAERAARVLAEEGFTPRVWVNHGGAHDFQNLLSGCGDLPENPEARGAPAPEYHLDLTRRLGLRYAWVGELTRVPGQERSLQGQDWWGREGVLLRELGGYLGRSLARGLGYRELLRRYPNPSPLRNRLLAPRRFGDGSVMQTFRRYGDFTRATFADLPWLLRPGFLDALEGGGGISLVFLHWARHPGRCFRDLDPRGLDALRGLARRAEERRVWVATTGRLLAYAEARRVLRVRTERGSGKDRVHLEASALPDGREIETADLAGISLRVRDPRAVEVMWRGEPLRVERVPGDDRAVWVPWRPLVFPEPPGVHA
jgi:hypothetical protein